MSNVNFFTKVFPLLEDKESIDLKIQRTGDELTVLLVPKIRSKTATITMSGTAEDLNEGFLEQLIIPVEKIKGLVSNAAEVKIEDAEEEEEEEEEEGSEKKEKPAAKKAEPKKAAAKKVTTKKSEEVKPKVEELVSETQTEGEINPEGKSTKEIEEEIEKQRIEEDTYLKEAADREEAAKKEAEAILAEEKAKKQAEEKRKAEEAEKLKEAFELAIKNGDDAFEARKYEEAEKHYQDANTLIPDHKEAKEKFEKANKWVKQLIAAGIIVREEVGHGA